jgi:small subunit ribosomal protein S16
LVKIRLKRVGRLHQVSFRIVACDEQAQRDGKTLEMLGVYDPKAKSEALQFHVKPERVVYWLRLGAQPTPTVAKLLKKKGIKVSEVRAQLRSEAKAAKAAKA